MLKKLTPGLAFLCVISVSYAQVPDLPIGLVDEPALPPGMSGAEVPPLPAGLEEEAVEEAVAELDETVGIEGLRGFWETRIGARTQDDGYQKSLSLAELRLHLDYEYDLESFTFNVGGDILYDHQADSHKVDLQSGEGVVDLRELNFITTELDRADFKVGRQILTWGTGDFLFINDLFPKDWNSFLLGRDEDYLKAPSDAIKASYYGGMINIDTVYTPQFDADRYIGGERLSYYSAAQDKIVGRAEGLITVDQPDDWLNDDEIALRTFGNMGSAEWAGYFYDGFWKSPAGQDALNGHSIFPELRVYGASVRDTLFAGIASVEIGYYESLEDQSGDNPLINNSEFRAMVGYEQELVSDLTMGFQWYLEALQDYDNYLSGLPAGSNPRDEYRHLLTTRFTYLTHNQNAEWSLFAFVSPTDKDFYLRPKVSYKLDDNWQMETGANIFGGQEIYTFWGQFEENSSIYAALRYGF